MAPFSPQIVQLICDRHRGVGSDGIVRAVKADLMPEWDGDPSLWFMDYWNPDGTIAEMCGNGLRVFARYLLDEDLVAKPKFQIATRAGLRTVWEKPGGVLRTSMGPAVIGQSTWVTVSGRRFDAISVNVGNPHAVVMLPDDVDLTKLDLHEAPGFDVGLFPNGVNTEFVHPAGGHHEVVRFFERGAGETRSCGTGAVAVAAVASQLCDGAWTIDVPGGRLTVDFDDDGAYLTGPAVIVARGDLVLPE